jgi:hypothetical protein
MLFTDEFEKTKAISPLRGFLSGVTDPCYNHISPSGFLGLLSRLTGPCYNHINLSGFEKGEAQAQGRRILTGLGVQPIAEGMVLL